MKIEREKLEKGLKILLPVLLVIMAIIYISNTPRGILSSASKKMSKLNSYQMVVDFTMGMESQGIEMEVPITVDTSYNSNSEAAKMDVSITYFGMKITSEGYVDYKDKKKVITYLKDSFGSWTKGESEESIDSKLAIDFIDAATKIKKVKSGDKSLYHYEITIKKDKMLELMKESTQLIGGNADMEVTDLDYEFSKDIVFDVYVNKKSKYITRMVLDLTDSIKMASDEAQGSEITKYTMELKFDNFNKVEDIKIPEEILKNAVDQRITDAKEDIKDYMQTIEYEYWFDDKFPDKVTATDLDKNGVVPDKVEVTLNSEGQVADGIIIVNGITGTIKNGEIINVK